MISAIAGPIFVFAVIVLVHEGGHFITAKLMGMKVEEFSIGFGPMLSSIVKGGTRYSLRLLPLGGFNRIAGMDKEESSDQDAFYRKPIWARLLVISAGSLFNILLAFFIFFGAFLSEGIQTFPNTPIIGQVIENTPAEKAGLQSGDRILSIDSKPVTEWTDVGAIVSPLGGHITPVVIQRDGEKLILHVIPQNNEENRGIMGIVPYIETQSVGVTEAARLSLERCVFILKMMTGGLWALVTGESADVAGPIGVARMAGSVAVGGFLPLFLFIALLSLNLGLLNLLPVPLLDGGLLVLTLIEGVLGRELPKKALYYIQGTGVVILSMLFVYALMNDISSLLK
ncbi:MAG: RIP metalloprotease RseP [Dialister sp.]|nr:RIP metalloprotease RseP [Dialister sp.]